LELVDLSMLSENKNISEEFFLKYVEKINLFELSGNSNMTIEFLLNNVPISYFVDKCDLALYRIDFTKCKGKYNNDSWMKALG